MLRRISARSEFAGFVAAGGIAATVNFLSRIAFSQFFGYGVSIVLAYGATLVTRNMQDFQRIPGLVIEDWTV